MSYPHIYKFNPEEFAAHDREVRAKELEDAIAEIQPKHLMPTEIWQEIRARAEKIREGEL